MTAAYFEPETIDDAVRLLSGEATAAGIIAGGTDLVVADRSGKQPLPKSLLAIHRVVEMADIAEEPDGTIRLGGIVTHAAMVASRTLRAAFTALPDSSSLVGSPATRNIGTLGGNLCNGSPAMESGGPLLVYNASVELAAESGSRTLPIDEFLTGPGTTALAAGELLTRVILPPPPTDRVGSAYLRLEYRRAMEIAVIGATALVALDSENQIDVARIALTAVAPTCIRAPEAEAELIGQVPSADLYQRAGQLAVGATRPIDDVRASSQYRTAMVPVLVSRALQVAVGRARGEQLPIPAVRVFE